MNLLQLQAAMQAAMAKCQRKLNPPKKRCARAYCVPRLYACACVTFHLSLHSADAAVRPNAGHAPPLGTDGANNGEVSEKFDSAEEEVCFTRAHVSHSIFLSILLTQQFSLPTQVPTQVTLPGGDAGGDMSEKFELAEEEVCACVLCAYCETLCVRMCHIPSFSSFC